MPPALQLVTVTLEEQVTVSGGHCAGLTVTVNVQLVLFPQVSEAKHDTVVVPTGKVLPLGGMQEGVTGPVQAFDAVLVKNTTVPPPGPPQLVAVTMMFDEQLSVSAQGVTVTVKLQVA